MVIAGAAGTQAGSVGVPRSCHIIDATGQSSQGLILLLSAVNTFGIKIPPWRCSDGSEDDSPVWAKLTTSVASVCRLVIIPAYRRFITRESPA